MRPGSRSSPSYLLHSVARALGAAAIVAGAALTGGCVVAATTVIPHPVTHAGVVATNRIVSLDRDRAGYFGLAEGVFAQEASLLLLDAQRACFAVTLRVERTTEALALPQGWRVFLRGSGGLEDMQPVFGPPAPVMVQNFPGTIPRQHFLGYYTDCVRMGYGTSCTQRPRYVTVREPAMIAVAAGTSSVCFAHGGRITANTDEITLHLDAPDDVTRRLAFRWRMQR
jgi:hypothetical protein